MNLASNFFPHLNHSGPFLGVSYIQNNTDMTLCKTKEEAKPMLYQTIIHNLTEVIIHSLPILTLTVSLLFNCHHQPQCNNTHFHKKHTHSNKLLSKCKYPIKLCSMNFSTVTGNVSCRCCRNADTAGSRQASICILL